jgi:sec-independent protein translocase protein TatC
LASWQEQGSASKFTWLVYTMKSNDDSRMPLRRHLEELRGCILRGGLVMVVLFAVGMAIDDVLATVMVKPWSLAREAMVADGLADPGRLGFIKPTEAFLFSMKVAMSFAMLLGAPYILYEVWRFIGVGLHSHERKAVFKAFPAAIALFGAGLSFGYLLVLPLALPILLTWIPAELARAQVTLQEYLSLLLTLTLLLGVVFELPILMWLIVRAGIVEVSTLASSRKVASLCMLIFAAIMTPPDPMTMVLVAGPMVGLYEVGLLVSRRAQSARDNVTL